MTITISEIKNEMLKKVAVKEDLDNDGKLNKEEMDSLFVRINKENNIMNVLSTAGKVVTGVALGCSGLGLATSIYLKSAKLASMFIGSGAIAFGGNKLFAADKNERNEALKELEALRTNFEVPIEEKHNIEVET